ncbi:hypothetical protein Np050604_031 [Cyanophage S-RIM44]|uniref:Uncharacterized protein n=2 Tax=Vellamovirus TaxID=2733139 RepID=A0A127KMY4_9CAUD|nr:hypothetical protein Syn1_027 [Prochlorococcus phage Syn1]YP_009783166.1 hypothetical protein HOQ83_gp028 [Cyanophage S-RIM44]ADO99129.1 hypothetical protein Syn1_027 [Prochlorococcus phage Syn1]AMO43276.1 hypothetical protein W270710_031 [Cyanophage S-RIM44]AOO11510.1 hypothetical protein ES420910_028 [Cyanophage S-RIM44]AOO11748.1 hypothetical protein Np050604_031 [Cyanophage S-RIM44]AOO11975.1 hypothetical protein Np200711_028 [Cyanophage S-RIM44]
MGETYQLSQRYVYLEGNAVRMYFIHGLPYTFDELPKGVEEMPQIQTEALRYRDYDLEELYRISSYLMEEECHPLMFDLQLDDPAMLPQDD